MTRTFLASCLLFPALLSAADSADVIIYGGSSGGITAAIQTARMGKTAILIEPTQFLGGLTTGGLGATDIGNKKAIGGMSREFYANIFKYYNDATKWKQETREAYFSRKPHGNTGSEDTMWTFEPHAATEIYDAMLKEAGDQVTVVKGERLDLNKGVVKEGAKITKIIMESGREFTGPMFIDATYEGDLMAKAGVSYHVGREANSVYGETLNGVQVGHSRSHQFIKDVDPYVKPGDPSSGLLPGIEKDPGEEFSGDRKVQAYNFRMCTTDDPNNKLDWEKPANYDEAWFELALRNVEAGDSRISWAPSWMPNRKTDTNNNFAISTDFIGANWDYPEADYETRAKIWKAHEDWQKGLMWTYAHHPRVPENIRAAFQKLGLAKDEFADNGHWPRQLYVREARRMIADYVMTEKNCKRTEIVEDSVGMGAYNMDSHNIQRYVTKEGFVRNEGDVQVRSRPYPISYRSIRPKADQCSNLLVPICLSASHISYGSIRMEPVFMVLGQSAATAAVQAIEQGSTVQGIDYEKLKARLLADGQVLDFESPPIPEVSRFIKKDLPGIVVDDMQASLTGFDKEGHTTPGFVEDGYRHDNNEHKGEQRARFTPELSAGKYEVLISYSALSNRATEVPVIIHHASGQDTVLVNQTKLPSGKHGFQPVGTYTFEAGQSGWVEISNQGTKGHVIIDAVQWLPVK
ncbi:FAD dependent oxidoreductase [Prosthecobacter debontii]|uniref:FAD dependent oxidoreductase n=1 Tax=Prosthecobacter debontii TaxID=48467 RepID=A0A1T4Z2V1_9BACT|nr:FAD-dependent oxidoreductase [Prosthecobacter debontii]SKB08370.1 FAD dependent oxidoreductase [Prosthecobacter debontii]